MDESECFVREVELEISRKLLTFYQKTVGDVSCVIWDASLVLARYLEKRAKEDTSWVKGNSVLELGAGVGCAGIVAASCGANVTVTDLPDVLPLLEHNIVINSPIWSEANGFVRAEELKWGQKLNQALQPPKVLILADCVYYTEAVNPLVNTMCSLSNCDTEILLCQEQRDSEKQIKVWECFMKEALKHFNFCKVPLNEQHPLFSSPDIMLLKGVKKSSVSHSTS